MLILGIIVALLIYGAVTWWCCQKWDAEKGVQISASLVTTAATAVLAIFTWVQIDQARDSKRMEMDREWSRLTATIRKITDQLVGPGGTLAIVKQMTSEQRIQLANSIRADLEAEDANSALLACDSCVEQWRNAITNAELISSSQKMGSLPPEIEESVLRPFEYILGEVSHVWMKVVMRSGKPIGGYPTPQGP